MKQAMRFLGVVLFMWSAGAIGSGQGTVAQRFNWLEGCWAGERGATRFREIWTVASPDLMLGLGVTTEASKPAEFDYFRIETRSGQPVYVAQPRGAPATPFVLQPSSPTDAPVFANPAHDFPKRVSYRRVDASSVLAFIDAGDTGAGRVEFPMKRVACPGPR